MVIIPRRCLLWPLRAIAVASGALLYFCCPAVGTTCWVGWSVGWPVFWCGTLIALFCVIALARWLVCVFYGFAEPTRTHDTQHTSHVAAMCSTLMFTVCFVGEIYVFVCGMVLGGIDSRLTDGAVLVGGVCVSLRQRLLTSAFECA